MLDNFDEVHFQQLRIVGEANGLVGNQAKVFAYLALDIPVEKFETEMGISHTNATSTVDKMWNKLKVKKDPNRMELLKELAIEGLKYYDLMEGIAKHNPHQIIDSFHKLDRETGR